MTTAGKPGEENCIVTGTASDDRGEVVLYELVRRATVAKMETVRMERKRRVTRTLEFYNLDLIISVGYQVNSARATRFRIWATRTLKDHLIRGYTLNERRLREMGLAEAEQAVQLLSRTLTRHDLVSEEGRGVLEVISRYARSWLLLHFIIKDHPFSDGNKRIGSFLFILFLRENGALQDASGEARINDNALVALALLIAESEPRNKELMIRLVMNLLAEAPA